MAHFDLLQDKTKRLAVFVNCQVGHDGIKVGWAYFAGMIGRSIWVSCDRTNKEFHMEIPEECRNIATGSEVSSRGNDYFLRFVDG